MGSIPDQGTKILHANEAGNFYFFYITYMAEQAEWSVPPPPPRLYWAKHQPFSYWIPGEGKGKNPMDLGAWQAAVHRVAKSWT